MRTWIMKMVTVITMVICVGGSLHAGQKQEQETLAERIARLEALEAYERAHESPEDKAIRLRAEQIVRDEAAKKAADVKKSKDTPAMHQAREEFRKAADRRHDAAEDLGKIRKKADVRGCRPDTVVLSEKAEEFTTWLDTASVRITNFTGEFLDIETPTRSLGLVVGNLCPDGSVTVSFSRKPGGSPQEIVLSAVYRSSRAAAVSTYRVYLQASVGTNGVASDSYNWVVGR